METMHNEYVDPFSQEQISDKTMTEIQHLKTGSNAYQAYDPNTDTDARELGGDSSYDVPLGSGLLPLSFILLLYILKKAMQTRQCSKIK